MARTGITATLVGLTLGLPLALTCGACGPGDPAAQPEGEALAPRALPPDSPGAWLVDRSVQAGLEAPCRTGARGEFHLPEIMGGGIAVFDADGDGALDLYLTQNGPDRLLLGGTRAPDGTPRFVDASERAGLATPGHGMGAAVGDIDGDGDLDLYVTRVGTDRLFVNRGDGSFEDRTQAAGLATPGWSTSAAFFDWNADGHPDLWVCRYVEVAPHERCLGWRGAPDYCGPLTQPALHDYLFTNRGDGTFVDSSAVAGLTAAPQPGLGLVCEDFDGDLLVDVFVANDAAPNQLWCNQGDGTFVDLAGELGLDANSDGALEAGMGVVVADFGEPAGPPGRDRPAGGPDLLLTHLRGESNTLYVGGLLEQAGRAGQGCFRDVTRARGLAGPSEAFTGFGLAAFDLECDGDLDLAVANGHVNRGEPNPYSHAPPPWNEFAEPDHLFLNDGTGHFTPAPREGAGLVRSVRTSRALVAADFDRDGDLDLVVADLEQPPRLLVNRAPRAGRWLSVRVLDAAGKHEVLGARVTVRAGTRRWQRTVSRAGGYLSSSPAELHFGLGASEALDALAVRWPDGTQEHFAPPAPDQRCVLVRGTGLE